MLFDIAARAPALGASVDIDPNAVFGPKVRMKAKQSSVSLVTNHVRSITDYSLYQCRYVMEILVEPSIVLGSIRIV